MHRRSTLALRTVTALQPGSAYPGRTAKSSSRASRSSTASTPEALSLIAHTTTEETHATGTKLFQYGDPGDKLFILIEGKVRISREVAGMGEEALAVLGPGEVFGEMSLLDEGTAFGRRVRACTSAAACSSSPKRRSRRLALPAQGPRLRSPLELRADSVGIAFERPTTSWTFLTSSGKFLILHAPSVECQVMTLVSLRGSNPNVLLAIALTVAACGGAPSQAPPPNVPPVPTAPSSSSSGAAVLPAPTSELPSAVPVEMKTPIPSAMVTDLVGIGLDPKNMPLFEKLDPKALRAVMKLMARSLGYEVR